MRKGSSLRSKFSNFLNKKSQSLRMAATNSVSFSSSDDDNVISDLISNHPETPQSLIMCRERQLRHKNTSDNIKCIELLNMITTIETPLQLYVSNSRKKDKNYTTMPLIRFAPLFYNAILIELRDMFRLLNSICSSKKNSNKVNIFCEWFEGFSGLLETMFESLETVVYSWLTEIGSSKFEQSVSLQRRKIKQQRINEQCSDIIDLKNSSQHQIQRECQLLTMNIIKYFHVQNIDLPGILKSSLTEDERKTVEHGIMRELRSSEEGKFVISSIVRCIGIGRRNKGIDLERRKFIIASLGESSTDGDSLYGQKQKEKLFQTESKESNGVNPETENDVDVVPKYMKRFTDAHTSIVEQLSPIELRIENPFESSSIVNDAFASPSYSSDDEDEY